MVATIDRHITTDASSAEEALVARARSGDHRAFETIMRANNRRLYRVARAILKDEHEAEDAVQEAYVRAFLGIGAFKGQSLLSTWLVRIVVNEALGRRRRRPATGSHAEIADMDRENTGNLFGLITVAEDPEKAAARSEIRRLLERAVDALPENFRTVFVMRAIEQMSIPETAQSLGIPEATVKTRFHRACRQLRAGLEERLGTALAGTFPFAGARCDRIVERVLSRLHS